MPSRGPWLLILLNLSIVALVSILVYRRLSLQAATIVAIVGLIVAIASGVGVSGVSATEGICTALELRDCGVGSLSDQRFSSICRGWRE